MIVYKQLTKQILNNRIFIVLLMMLCILTSASFFFIRFTTDVNLNLEYEVAIGDVIGHSAEMSSNRELSYIILTVTIILTAFVFFIFFYRFYSSECKQLGCLKALGFKDKVLRRYFLAFTMVFTIVGGLIGLIISYPLSDILLQANINTYGVIGLVRDINIESILLYFTASIGTFSLVTFLSYRFIKGKEPGNLISGNLNKEEHTTH